jgi:ABC-type multidrug transport system fused ATPase/permease subunit
MMHLLLRFYDPRKGAIEIDGTDLRKSPLPWVHSQMAVVAQDTQLFAATIEENIAYGIENYTKAELEEAARFANAHDFILTFEDGYQTKVGERGVRLSGGQKQRIAIARTFLRKPKVLLLDEATSSLDAESEAQVQAALDSLISNLQGGRCTIMVIAHRLSTVINADNIAVLDDGVVKEQGTHNELLKLGEIYANLVSRQVGGMLQDTPPPEGTTGAPESRPK